MSRNQTLSLLSSFALVFAAAQSVPVAMAVDAKTATDTAPEVFEIGFGLSGAWYNPETPGQGWMLDVSPQDNLFFAAWFTWQGEGEYDWYTVQGNYVGNGAVVPLLRTSGGRFNDPQPTQIDQVGAAEFKFQDCQQGEVQLRFEDDEDVLVMPLYRITAAPHACTHPEPEVQFRFGSRAEPDGSEDFVAATRDPALVAQLRAQLELPEAERTLFINGVIERGNAGHNLDWNWHFVGNAWSLVEVAIELCDGRASLVEEDLDYWIDTVGRYCPWGSFVRAELGGELPR